MADLSGNRRITDLFSGFPNSLELAGTAGEAATANAYQHLKDRSGTAALDSARGLRTIVDLERRLDR
jgi:hypothetical protein